MQNFNYYFNIGLIYMIIGLAVAIVYHFFLKKPVLGRFWGALAVAVIGSFLGGVLEFFLKDIIEKLANIKDAVNIFPPLITAFLLIWLFSKVSARDPEDE